MSQNVRSVRRTVRRAIKRLKMSGLNAKVVMEDDYGVILIPMEEIIKYINRKISYPNHKTKIEGNMLIVEVWA